MSEAPDTSQAALAREGVLASRTIIGAAWLLTWRMLSRSLGLVSTLILARVLVPGDFGIVAMATTFTAAVDTLSQIGVQDALVRHLDDDRRLFNTGFTLQVGRALITSAIIAGAAPAASLWFNEPRLVPLLLVLAAASLVSGFENIGIVEFSRAMRFDVQFLLNSLPRLLQVAVTISMALLLKSYWALLMGIVTAKVARTIMSYWVHPYRPRLEIAGWREIAGFSFWTWAAWMASLVWDRIDPFVLGPLIGPAQLGLYLLALELAVLPVSEFVEPATYALFAGFARAQKQGGSSIHHAPLVTAMLVICIAPFTITISCASGYVVAALLGPKWIAASPLVAIMAWLCLFSPLSYVCNAVLVANNFVRRNFVGKVIASVGKLVVLLTAVSLTKRLDLIAAAIVVCVTIESCAYMLLLRGADQLRFGPMIGAIGRALLAGLLVVVVLYEAGLAWNAVSAPSLHAFYYGSLIGLLVITLYGVLVLGFWLLAGRPEGAETRLLDLASRFMRRFSLRLRVTSVPP